MFIIKMLIMWKIEIKQQSLTNKMFLMLKRCVKQTGTLTNH